MHYILIIFCIFLSIFSHASNRCEDIFNSSPKAKLVSYNEAREIVQTHGIKNTLEYRRFRKETGRTDLPANPDKFYGIDWVNGGTSRGFFGTEFIPYIEAKNLVLNAGISSVVEYRKWRLDNNLTETLPADPTKHYEELRYVANPFGEFINSARIHGLRSEIVSYAEAKSIVLSNGITSILGYRKFRKENQRFDLPADPDHYYTDEWKANGGAIGFFTEPSILERLRIRP